MFDRWERMEDKEVLKKMVERALRANFDLLKCLMCTGKVVTRDGSVIHKEKYIVAFTHGLELAQRQGQERNAFYASVNHEHGFIRGENMYGNVLMELREEYEPLYKLHLRKMALTEEYVYKEMLEDEKARREMKSKDMMKLSRKMWLERGKKAIDLVKGFLSDDDRMERALCVLEKKAMEQYGREPTPIEKAMCIDEVWKRVLVSSRKEYAKLVSEEESLKAEIAKKKAAEERERKLERERASMEVEKKKVKGLGAPSKNRRKRDHESVDRGESDVDSEFERVEKGKKKKPRTDQKKVLASKSTNKLDISQLGKLGIDVNQLIALLQANQPSVAGSVKKEASGNSKKEVEAGKQVVKKPVKSVPPKKKEETSSSEEESDGDESGGDESGESEAGESEAGGSNESGNESPKEEEEGNEESDDEE